MTTDTPVQQALLEQVDGIQSRIDIELRKARKAQTATDKLFHDGRAQVLRKRKRAVLAQYYDIEDAKA